MGLKSFFSSYFGSILAILGHNHRCFSRCIWAMIWIALKQVIIDDYGQGWPKYSQNNLRKNFLAPYKLPIQIQSKIHQKSSIFQYKSNTNPIQMYGSQYIYSAAIQLVWDPIQIQCNAISKFLSFLGILTNVNIPSFFLYDNIANIIIN